MGSEGLETSWNFINKPFGTAASHRSCFPKHRPHLSQESCGHWVWWEQDETLRVHQTPSHSPASVLEGEQQLIKHSGVGTSVSYSLAMSASPESLIIHKWYSWLFALLPGNESRERIPAVSHHPSVLKGNTRMKRGTQLGMCTHMTPHISRHIWPEPWLACGKSYLGWIKIYLTS